jgi:hypothetical protein
LLTARGDAATDGSDVDDVDDTPGTHPIGRTDPFRPAFGNEDDPDGDDVSMDRIFTVLGNERRRYALAYLSTRTGVVTMADLVERVAAWECGKHPKQLGSRERERVQVSMCHSHLPKLADASAIAYDGEQGTIERGDRFEQFAHYLCSDE